jgi:MFS transporter, YNFM family, putative membrane transport protein
MTHSAPASAATGPRPIGRGEPAFARVTASFFLGGFATFELLYSVQPLLPMFAREFDLTPASAALAVSVATLVMAPALIVAGSASEFWGRKRMMVVALTLSSLATLASALSPSWAVLLVLRALMGFALSGLPAIAMAYLVEEMAPAALGLAMGLYIAGSTLGGMFGRLAVAVLADFWGWRIAIGAVGVNSLLGAIFFVYALPRERAFAARAPDVSGLWRTFRGHFSDRGLRLLYAEGFLVMGSFVCIYNYIGFRLAAPPFSLSPTTIGLVFVLYLVGAASSAVMGDLAGRIGRRRVLWIAAAIELLGVAITLPDNLFAIVGGVALITWGFFGVHSIVSSWVGLRAQTGRAQAAALYLFFYYMGSSLGGWSGGLFYSRWQWPGVAGLVGAMVAGALFIAVRLSKVAPPLHLQAR